MPIHIAASASLNTSMTALLTDNPVYAEYLVSTFEILWKQLVPAEERIQELLEQGPAQVLSFSHYPSAEPAQKLYNEGQALKRHASPVSHINIIN